MATYSMPTPPFSPQNFRMPDENAQNPLNSTISLLDTLVAFYQQERMWVCRTRAVLDNAFSAPSEFPNIDNIMYSDNHLPPPSFKTRMDQSYDRYNPMGNHRDHQGSRWTRRKKGFKLRIDGIRAKPLIDTQPVDQVQDVQLDELLPTKQILDMFDRMMETRLESCQRVNKLIRDANQANFQ